MTDFITSVATSAAPVAARIAWVTDIHTEKTGTTTGTEYVAVRNRLIASMRKKTFDYILDSGDALDGSIASGTLAEQAAQYAIFRDAFTQPFINALGNHEYLFSDSLTDVKAAIGMTDSYYSFEVPGTDYVIIILNSCELNGTEEMPYNLGSTQRSWLTTQIAGYQDKYVILVTHVPVTGISSAMWRTYQADINPVQVDTHNLTSDLHTDVLFFFELADANPCIKAMLCGHSHTASYSRDETNGVEYFDGGSVAGFYYNGTDNWHGKVRGWNYLTLFADGRITREYIRI